MTRARLVLLLALVAAALAVAFGLRPRHRGPEPSRCWAVFDVAHATHPEVTRRRVSFPCPGESR